MPAYDYRCDDCGEEFTVRLSISAYSAGATMACARCGSAHTTRQLGTVAVLSGGRTGGGASANGCASGFT